MKRNRLLSTTALVLFSLFLVAAASDRASAKTIEVFLNGTQKEARKPPLIQNGRTLVHIRETFEWLGAIVWWNPTDQSIRAWRHEDEIRLQIGNGTAQVNGRNIALDQPPILHHYGPAQRATLVPLRFVSQALGANVRYDSTAHRVYIDMQGFGTEAFYKAGDRVEYLQRQHWLPGEVLKVRESQNNEPSYTVRVTEKSGRPLTVTVGRTVLRSPR